MKIDEILIKALTAYDATRERSLQKEVGVSQVGGCRKQVWLQLQGTVKENTTLKLPSLMGTAIHKMIEEALTNDNELNWSNYQLEREVEWDGLKGHIDLFIPDIGAVVDWKTTKLKNLDYFPSKQQRWQVQLYGYLLEMNGEKPKTVTLVAIPRDGDERQIRIHTEEYNREICVEALAWLDEVKEMKEPPAPERFAAQFCQHYCSYYGTACSGKGKDIPLDPITDEVIIQAVKQYLQLSSEIKEKETARDGVKAALENINGVIPDGTKVVWSQVAGRSSIDEQAVKLAMGEVPKKVGEPSMRLTVK